MSSSDNASSNQPPSNRASSSSSSSNKGSSRSASSKGRSNPASSNQAPSDPQPTTKSAAARLFDIRLMIGGLFALYGVLLTVYGFFTTDAELKKAAGININLWLGLGMLVLGALFLLWMRLAPVQAPDPGTVDHSRPAAH